MKKTIFVIISMVYFTNYLVSQNTINGTITDLSGEPLSGAIIEVKETTRGTIADVNGTYTLGNISESDVLVFRFLGFRTQEIKVGNQTTINVELIEAVTELDEMVVVGYGVTKKIDFTGSVSSVNFDDVVNTATSNFDQSLAGRIPGVQVTSTDGTPGEGLNIIIRGGNSITGDNSPLFVVDGIAMDDFNPASINSRDIKSFDILKDASATAIYGSRGANGVILITTKDGGDDGKTTVSLHASTGLQYIPNRLEVMNAYEYVKHMQRIAWAHDNYSPGNFTRVFNESWVDPELYRGVKGTNWQDEIFRTALIQNYNVSIGWGSKTNSFFYSGGFVDQPGTLLNSSFSKYNNRLRFKSTINENLIFNGQITYDRFLYTGLQVTGSEYTSIIKNAVVYRPVQPIYSRFDSDEEEESVIQDQDPYLYNPVETLKNTERKRAHDVISGNLNLQYKFLEKFTLNILGSYRRNIREQSLFYGADTQQANRTSDGINGSIDHRTDQVLSNSNTLNYNTRKGKSRYEVLGGLEFQNRLIFSSSLKNANIPMDAFGIDNLGIATTPTIATSGKTENSLYSYFGRLNYNYNNLYLLTVNFRADASSKFQKENRWGYFPSFSAAWRASDEPFLKDIKQISNLKPRLGWGVTGNNRIGDFVSYNLISVTSGSGYVLGNGENYSPGAFQSNMAVPDLRWETTSQLNVGIDFGLFNSRINGTIDYYTKRTKDLLLNAQMAPSTGFSNVQQNVGEVENSGFEFYLNALLVENTKFRWSTDFNISFNKNKTIALNRGERQMLIDPRWDRGYAPSEYQYVTRVGEPVGMIYGLEYEALYQLEDFNWDSGTETYSLKPGLPTYGGVMYPGLPKFKDQLTIDTDGDGIPDVGDGVINEEDRIIIGNPHPKHFGGLTNDLKYRNFDVQILLQWSYGFDILNANKAVFTNYSNNYRNGYPELANAWTPENTDTNISGIRFDNNRIQARTGYRVDSRYVDDGSYLKLKTLVVGYSLPRKLLSKSTIRSCRFYLTAQNLLTLTNYEGYDPDVSAGRYGALTPSLDYSAYPQSIALAFGVDIKF